MNRLAAFAMMVCFATAGAAAKPENLAAGKPVRFLPEPNYA
jgi:hypothetical protein